MQILAIQNFENKINLKYFWTMKKLMFLMFALVMGFSASAQTLPDVKIENQEGKVISVREVVDGTPNDY